MSTRRRFENVQKLLDAIDRANAYVNLPPSILNAAQDVQEEFKDELSGDAVLIKWGVDDIDSEDDYDLTDEQKRDILTTIERKHDPDIGINWEVIYTHVKQSVDKV